MILLTRRISLITMLNFLMRILFIVNRDTESKDMVIPENKLEINPMKKKKLSFNYQV